MKKGCFYISITIFTILIGVGLYLYKKYWPEIKNYGYEKVMQIALEEVNEKIDKLDKSKYQDSLKVFLKKETDRFIQEDTENSFKRFEDLIDQVKYFINDGIIDSLEIKALKNLANKNERSEKNRN